MRLGMGQNDHETGFSAEAAGGSNRTSSMSPSMRLDMRRRRGWPYRGLPSTCPQVGTWTREGSSATYARDGRLQRNEIRRRRALLPPNLWSDPAFALDSYVWDMFGVGSSKGKAASPHHIPGRHRILVWPQRRHWWRRWSAEGDNTVKQNVKTISQSKLEDLA
jgi:hypothetical protein